MYATTYNYNLLLLPQRDCSVEAIILHHILWMRINDTFVIVNDTELAFDEIIEVMNDYYGPVARELFGIPKFKEIKYTLLIYLWITIANDCFTKFFF